MSGQPGKNMIVAYKAESSFNTPATGAGATVFRFQPTTGLSLKSALIEDPEVRRDAQRSTPRLGSKNVSGSYIATLSQATFEALFAAVFRTTWGATVAITQATMTSVTTTANSIVASAGSWVTQGVKVGDIIVSTGLPDAGNNSRNLRVTSVTALTLGIAETLIVNAAPDSTFTITIQRKLINNATTLTRSSYTFEEYSTDFDDSEIFTGCRIASFKVTFGPDAVVTVEFGIVGANETIPGSASAPTYTSPTATVTIGLVATDATIRANGVDVTTMTALEISADLTAKGMPVIGSRVTPDIWENAFNVRGSFTAVRTALTGSSIATYLAETDNIELHVMLVEPTAEPKPFVSFFLPRIKYLDTGKGRIGDDGALMETVPFYASVKATTTGYDAVTMAMSTAP